VAFFLPSFPLQTLLSLPIQVNLMHCSRFVISLDISPQGVLHTSLSFQLIPESNEDLNARYGICSCRETLQLNHLGSQNGRN